jgi:hypothetical protein
MTVYKILANPSISLSLARTGNHSKAKSDGAALVVGGSGNEKGIP